MNSITIHDRFVCWYNPYGYMHVLDKLTGERFNLLVDDLEKAIEDYKREFTHS